MLYIHSIELTNICNLACVYCPSSKSIYPRGMVSLETFEKAMQTLNKLGQKQVGLVGFGESLMHPEFNALIDLAKKYDIEYTLYTNGILLTNPILEHMVQNNLIRLEISMHNDLSFLAYKTAYWYLKTYHPHIDLAAVIISTNSDKLQEWASKHIFYFYPDCDIKIIDEHNWALNQREQTQEEINKWQSKCNFLNNNVCAIRWDGTVCTCCADSEGINIVGHIDDFENLSYDDKSKFTLCYKCSPAWFTGEVTHTQLTFK